MKQYKYITINMTDEVVAGRPTYRIVNNRTTVELGQIGWWAPWKRYVAHFFEEAVWSDGCLDDVSDFIKNHAGRG